MQQIGYIGSADKAFGFAQVELKEDDVSPKPATWKAQWRCHVFTTKQAAQVMKQIIAALLQPGPPGDDAISCTGFPDSEKDEDVLLFFFSFGVITNIKVT